MSRIALVSQQRSQQIEAILLRMAQGGQLRSKVTENQLIDLLDQVRSRCSRCSKPFVSTPSLPIGGRCSRWRSEIDEANDHRAYHIHLVSPGFDLTAFFRSIDSISEERISMTMTSTFDDWHATNVLHKSADYAPSTFTSPMHHFHRADDLFKEETIVQCYRCSVHNKQEN